MVEIRFYPCAQICTRDLTYKHKTFPLPFSSLSRKTEDKGSLYRPSKSVTLVNIYIYIYMFFAADAVKIMKDNIVLDWELVVAVVLLYFFFSVAKCSYKSRGYAILLEQT